MNRDIEVFNRVRKVRQLLKTGDPVLATHMAKELIAEGGLEDFIASYLSFVVRIYSNHDNSHSTASNTVITKKQAGLQEEWMGMDRTESKKLLDPDRPTYYGIVTGLSSYGILVRFIQIKFNKQLSIEAIQLSEHSEILVSAHQEGCNNLVCTVKTISTLNSQVNIFISIDGIRLIKPLLLRFEIGTSTHQESVAFQVLTPCLAAYGRVASLCTSSHMKKRLDLSTLNTYLKEREIDLLLNEQLITTSNALKEIPLYVIRFTDLTFSCTGINPAPAVRIVENDLIGNLNRHLSSLPSDSFVLFAAADCLLREDYAIQAMVEIQKLITRDYTNNLVCFDHLIRLPGRNEYYVSHISSSLVYNLDQMIASQALCKVWLIRLNAQTSHALSLAESEETQLINASAIIGKLPSSAIKVSTNLMGMMIDLPPPREEQRQEETELPWSGNGTYGSKSAEADVLIRKSKMHHVGAILLTTKQVSGATPSCQEEKIELDHFIAHSFTAIDELDPSVDHQKHIVPSDECNHCLLNTDDLSRQISCLANDFVYITSSEYSQPDEIMLATLLNTILHQRFCCSVSPSILWRKNMASPFSKILLGYHCQVDQWQTSELIPHVLPPHLSHLNVRVQVGPIMPTLYHSSFLVSALQAMPTFVNRVDLHVLLAIEAYKAGYSQLVLGDCRLTHTITRAIPSSVPISKQLNQCLMASGLLAIQPFISVMFQPQHD